MLMLLFSCQENEALTNEFDESAHRACASHEVLEEQMRQNPQLAVKMSEIEEFTKNVVLDQGRLVNGKIEIPVVVNVLYKTAAENISLAQIQSQIDVLNKDFNGTNTDFNNVPSAFSGVKATVGISFVLDQVIRKSTTKSSWRTDDSMKKSNKGGINPTSPTTKLNEWWNFRICTISRWSFCNRWCSN